MGEKWSQTGSRLAVSGLFFLLLSPFFQHNYEISNLPNFHSYTNTHLTYVVLTQFMAVNIQGKKSILAGPFFCDTRYIALIDPFVDLNQSNLKENLYESITLN